VQSALDAFTIRLTENYPRGIHADSVQITDDGVTAPLLRKPHRPGEQGGVGRPQFPLAGRPSICWLSARPRTLTADHGKPAIRASVVRKW
jgi:hypothetical protein